MDWKLPRGLPDGQRRSRDDGVLDPVGLAELPYGPVKAPFTFLPIEVCGPPIQEVLQVGGHTVARAPRGTPLATSAHQTALGTPSGIRGAGP